MDGFVCYEKQILLDKIATRTTLYIKRNVNYFIKCLSSSKKDEFSVIINVKNI
jgi:hypothetical protein